jgi:hypothetical protein
VTIARNGYGDLFIMDGLRFSQDGKYLTVATCSSVVLISQAAIQ